MKSGLGELLAKSLAAAIQNMHYLFYDTDISQLRSRWLCGTHAPVCNQPFSVLPKFVDTGHQTQRQTIASCKTSIFYLSMFANVASHTLWGIMKNKNLVLSKRGGNNSRTCFLFGLDCAHGVCASSSSSLKVRLDSQLGVVE